MHLSEVRKMQKDKGPYTRATMYKLSSTQRYPNLLYRVGGILMWDWDEWKKMAEAAKAENIRRASKLRNVKG